LGRCAGLDQLIAINTLINRNLGVYSRKTTNENLRIETVRIHEVFMILAQSGKGLPSK
jgi:hypothetical protein